MNLEPKQLARTRELKCPDILFCIAGQSNSQSRWVGSSDFGIYEVSEQDAQLVRKPFADKHTSYVTGLVVSGEQVISGSYDRHLIWWDGPSRTPKRKIIAHDRWIRRLALTPDRRCLITIADDMLCKVWDVETGEPIAAFTDHRPQTPNHYPSMLYALAISDDGSFLATGDKIGHVAIWDAKKFVKVGELDAPVMYTWDPVKRHHSIGGIRSLSFSPDGQRLAVGGIGTIGNIDHLGGPARLEIFDWRSKERQLVIEDQDRKGLIEQIAWAPNASWIATVGGDHKGFISFWHPESGESLHHEVCPGHIHGFVIEPESGLLTTAGHEQIAQWNASGTT